MSTMIYLIRHGETAGNVEVRYIGWTDIPLDAKGVVQAQELCYKLQQCAIDEIYASPLQRAIATAAPIAEVLRKQIHIENGLKEINCGAWETLTAKQVCEKWPKELDNWANHPDKLKIPEGDSFADVQKRMISALGAIARANQGKKCRGSLPYGSNPDSGVLPDEYADPESVVARSAGQYVYFQNRLR